MMKVFLVQHGEAVPEEVNAERPLSEKGRDQAHRAAELIKKMPEYPALILHSGKKRARETAEIISFTLGGVRMETREYLNPRDDTAAVSKELAGSELSVMVVGHMPFLGKLASRLFGLDEERETVDIMQASPLVFSRYGRAYVLDTYIKNDYLR
jgi:phosphohistidine phosphatase